MFGRKGKLTENALAQANAISRSQAVIEFDLDGTIVEANENFLQALGYSLAEIRGQHLCADGRARQCILSGVLGKAQSR